MHVDQHVRGSLALTFISCFPPLSAAFQLSRSFSLVGTHATAGPAVISIFSKLSSLPTANQLRLIPPHYHETQPPFLPTRSLCERTA